MRYPRCMNLSWADRQEGLLPANGPGIASELDGKCRKKD